MDVPDPVQVFMFVLRVLPVIVLIIAVLYLGKPMLQKIKYNEVDMVGMELSENIINSATGGKAVFDADVLDRYDLTYEEPFARQCKYGYNVVINEKGSDEKKGGCNTDSECYEPCATEYEISENFPENFKCDNNYCKCKKDGRWRRIGVWEFGYKPYASLNAMNSEIKEIFKPIHEYSIVLPVGIRKDYRADFDETITPALLTINIYETVLTRISCLAETAYYTGKEQKMEMQCVPWIEEDCFMDFEFNADKHLICLNDGINNNECNNECRKIDNRISIVSNLESYNIGENDDGRRNIIAKPDEKKVTLSIEKVNK